MMNIKCIRLGFCCVLPIIIWFSNTYAELRDPTRPASYIDETSNTWELNAIIISPKRRVAVIDGKSVQIDDEINGEKVVAIESSSVILDGSEGKMTLFLLDKPVKKELEK